MSNRSNTLNNANSLFEDYYLEILEQINKEYSDIGMYVCIN